MDDELNKILEKEVTEIIDSRMLSVSNIYTKIRFRFF
jgi:hypothetical protein